MYVEASEACNTLSFQLSASATVTRQWAIKVTQFNCNYNNLPPPGCTQWYFGDTTGTIQSFNWANKVHLANQNQLICIRRERNTCQVCYAADPASDFKVSGADNKNAEAAMGKCGEYAADGLAATAHVDHVIIPNASKGADGAQLAISAFCGGNLERMVMSMMLLFAAKEHHSNSDLWRTRMKFKTWSLRLLEMLLITKDSALPTSSTTVRLIFKPYFSAGRRLDDLKKKPQSINSKLHYSPEIKCMDL